MLIREATAGDAMDIAQLLKQISEVQSAVDKSTEELCEDISRGLSVVGISQTSTVLVGVANTGEMAGYCAVHWVPFLFLPGGEAYVTELFVRPDSREAGLGSTLLAEVERRACERGCSRISLLNGRQGEAYKRGFYRKRNWVEREQMANFILPLGDVPKH